MSETRSYIVAPRDIDLPQSQLDQALRALSAAVPGLRIGPRHGDTNVTTIDIPSGAVKTAEAILGDAFILEPNASLRY